MSPVSNDHLRRRSYDFGIGTDSSDSEDTSSFAGTNGIIFNPPTIDKMLDLCMKNGKFSNFSISMQKFNARPDVSDEGFVIRYM